MSSLHDLAGVIAYLGEDFLTPLGWTGHMPLLQRCTILVSEAPNSLSSTRNPPQNSDLESRCRAQPDAKTHDLLEVEAEVALAACYDRGLPFFGRNGS